MDIEGTKPKNTERVRSPEPFVFLRVVNWDPRTEKSDGLKIIDYGSYIMDHMI